MSLPLLECSSRDGVEQPRDHTISALTAVLGSDRQEVLRSAGMVAEVHAILLPCNAANAIGLCQNVPEAKQIALRGVFCETNPFQPSPTDSPESMVKSTAIGAATPPFRAAWSR